MLPLLMQSIEEQGKARWGEKEHSLSGRILEKFSFETSGLQYTLEAVSSDRYTMFRLNGHRNLEDIDLERGFGRRGNNILAPRSIIMSNGRVCAVMTTH